MMIRRKVSGLGGKNFSFTFVRASVRTTVRNELPDNVIVLLLAEYNESQPIIPNRRKPAFTNHSGRSGSSSRAELHNETCSFNSEKNHQRHHHHNNNVDDDDCNNSSIDSELLTELIVFSLPAPHALRFLVFNLFATVYIFERSIARRQRDTQQSETYGIRAVHDNRR